MIDIVTEINATRRAVEAGRGGADDVYAVRLRRCYDAPALLGFGRYLSGHEPDEARSWSQSAQAREFMTRSSRAWGAAHEASGATAAEAGAAAERTASFYTAEPQTSG